jgi:hypothetical protein
LGNEIPRPQDGGRLPEEFPLDIAPQKMTISEPFGMDNYFVLSTSQAIDDPASVFAFAGVRTRSMDSAKGANNPLERLISSRSAGTRGAISGVPTDWSIERFSFRSLPPEK